MALTPKHIKTIKDALKNYRRSLSTMKERNRDNQLLFDTYNQLHTDAEEAEKAL